MQKNALPIRHIQLNPSELINQAVLKGEGALLRNGALNVQTGKFTGRTPKDKFMVNDETTKSIIHWGKVNQPMTTASYEQLNQKLKNRLKEIETYEFNGFIGTNSEYKVPVRVVTEFAWHNLFAHQLLVRPTKQELQNFIPEFTVMDIPSLLANPDEDGTNSEAFIVTNMTEKTVLIGGTEYAGEIKKSLFGIMNYLLPLQDVLPMHCSANIGEEGDTALFFGLSGTGKTTLSSAADRRLIGDDEHGWTDTGVFNFEGGCYAKTIGLTEEKEPDIFRAIKHGALLENVTLHADGMPNYEDGSITENTRTAYPIHHIDNSVETGQGGIPKTIFFLTADAFGVLPPISKLTEEQAKYYFINGYTSKLAGTEKGVTKPEATFSACFGEPFLPLAPMRYTELFGEKMKEHQVDVYLINTGWLAGGYGKSDRISLKYTRNMINAALNGNLKKVEYQKDEVFGLHVPTECPGVPTDLLNPINSWNDKKEYIQQASALKELFKQNSIKFEQTEGKKSGKINKMN